MLNVFSRAPLIGAWITVSAVVVTVSAPMVASLTTTMLLVALGVAPGIVIALLRDGVASPTGAAILDVIDAKDGRP